MIFFYIRHGDPIYVPDKLSPLGERQAEALAKRLAVYGLDRIYASTSGRAMATAQPTCELLRKKMRLLDFAHENYAGERLEVIYRNKRGWVFDFPDIIKKLATWNVTNPDEPWYDMPEIKDFHIGNGIDQYKKETDDFFLSLGYEHIEGTGMYKVVKPNDERIALFAHQGFGMAFLSCLLDIPYPTFISHFDLSHSSMTVIEFKEVNGYTIPKVCTLSSDSHLYREGLPTEYNYRLKF